MKLERVCVADREPGRMLHLNGRPPSVQIAMDPKGGRIGGIEDAIRRILCAAPFSYDMAGPI